MSNQSPAVTATRLVLRGPSLVALAVAGGIVLRLIQYLGDRSLWFDEVASAQCIIDRSAVQLALRPLDPGVVAPLGFVELEKLSVTVFGSGERALRFWPFVAGVAALVLFARLARLLVPEIAAGAVALFAVAPPLVYYSAEVKPYGFDVCVAVALALAVAAVMADRVTRARRVAVALVGIVGPWLSLPAAFGVAGAATVIAAHGWARGGRHRVAAITLTGLWVTSAVLALVDVHHSTDPTALDWLRGYWAAGFFPIPPRSLHDATWLIRCARGLCAMLFLFPLPLLIVPMAAAGIARMVERHRAVGMAVVLPLIFALGAAALHTYPLEGRLALFLAPLTVLAVASAVGLVAGVPRLGHAAAATAIGILLVAPAVSFARNPTAVHEDLRPVVAELAIRRQPGDVIYIYCWADDPFRYYAARYGIPLADVDFGTCEHARLERYRGRRRVWVIASHFLAGGPFEPPASFAGHVATIGRPTDSIVAAGAWARLFDLSDPSTSERPLR